MFSFSFSLSLLLLETVSTVNQGTFLPPEKKRENQKKEGKISTVKNEYVNNRIH